MGGDGHAADLYPACETPTTGSKSRIGKRKSTYHPKVSTSAPSNPDPKANLLESSHAAINLDSLPSGPVHSSLSQFEEVPSPNKEKTNQRPGTCRRLPPSTSRGETIHMLFSEQSEQTHARDSLTFPGGSVPEDFIGSGMAIWGVSSLWLP